MSEQQVDLYELMIALNSADDETRQAAYTTLTGLGSDAVPHLIAMFPDIAGSARLRVIEALGEIGDGRAAQLLCDLVRSKDSQEYIFVSSYAAKALSRIGDPVPVLRLLDEDQLGPRRMAAVVLGNIGDAQAVPRLIDAMHGSDGKLAGLAARALEQIGTPGALAALELWRGNA